jgi:hypothetical protein
MFATPVYVYAKQRGRGDKRREALMAAVELWPCWMIVLLLLLIAYGV